MSHSYTDGFNGKFVWSQVGTNHTPTVIMPLINLVTCACACGNWRARI